MIEFARTLRVTCRAAKPDTPTPKTTKAKPEMKILLHPEFIALLLKLAAVAAFVVKARRAGARGRVLAAAGWAFWTGLVITVLLALHCVQITSMAFSGVYTSATGFAYDFRYYSLMLLAAVLLPQGARMLKCAWALARGREEAGSRLTRASVVVLAVTLPLIPIQMMAATLSAFCLLNLAGVFFVRRQAARRQERGGAGYGELAGAAAH